MKVRTTRLPLERRAANEVPAIDSNLHTAVRGGCGKDGMRDTVVPPELQERAYETSNSPAGGDWLIVAGIGLLIGLIATAWVYYRHRSRPRPIHALEPPTPLDSLMGHRHHHSRHGHSRRRRKGRRNPTLAQTGGLPPERPNNRTAAQSP